MDGTGGTLITWFLKFCCLGIVVAIIVAASIVIFSIVFISCVGVFICYQWYRLRRQWFRLHHGRCPGCNQKITSGLEYFSCKNPNCHERNSEIIISLNGRCSFCGGKLAIQHQSKMIPGQKPLGWELLTCKTCYHHVKIPLVALDGRCGNCGGKIENTSTTEWRNGTYHYDVHTCTECGESERVFRYFTGSMKGRSGYDEVDWRPGGIGGF